MTSSERKSRAPLFIALLLGLVGGAAAAWWYWRPEPEGSKSISADQARGLIAQKDLALAQLENAEFADSFSAFSQIAQKLPQEPLPVQNQLLGLLWALRDRHPYADDPNDPSRRQAVLQEAAQTLEQYRAFSPEPALLHFLEARLAVQQNEPQAAVAALRQAAAADPKNPIYPAQIYEILNQTGEPAAEAEARQALHTAWELSPENLYLVRKLAFVQAQQQDPALAETLEAMRKAYAPFFGTVKDQLGFEMGAAIDQALTAVREKNWPQAFARAAPLHNAPDRLPAQQFDYWRLDPHELEFVAYDFSPDFYAAADLPVPPAPEPIPVQLTPAPDDWQLPDLADAVAVRLADFDLDGRHDVIVLRPRSLEVHGRDTVTATWKLLAGFELPAEMSGVVAADLDRDIHENLPLAALAAPPPAADPAPVKETPQCLLADVDLIVYGLPGVLILKNLYDRDADTRSLQAVDDPGLAEVRNVRTAAVADIDHDGDLDLVLSAEAGMSLWSNRENFTFDPITEFSQPPPADFAATSIKPVDWDRDVYLDLVLGNAAGEAGVWKNYGNRNLRWEPLDTTAASAARPDQTDQQPSPIRYAEPTVQVLDADGNVAWDLLTGGPRGISLIANANPRAGVVQARKTTVLTESPVSGLITWDYDNDGYLDLLAWTSREVMPYRASPSGAFLPVTGLFPEPPADVRNAHVADFDQDGDQDLLLETAAGPKLYWNEGGNANHSFTFSLGADREAQRPRERVNMHGIGSLAELKAGPLYQARVVDEQILHFGLGQKEAADLLRILWTNGIPQNALRPVSRQMICIEQKLKGSCPYIYTWNGSEWVFYTDCLWAAPLGLQFARGVLAPAREWEYLTVEGDALAEQDGHYRLMLTEELWEAAYLDEIRLIAVDHPAEVEIFSNEKVGPAEIAAFRIHTVRNPRPPVAARNHRGRDVLELIAHRDKKFVQLFDTGQRQGLVEPHWLELDLGDLDEPRQITLFLRGWTWPTDTSINLALDENPELPAPQPPSLWVPNAEGEWIEAIPYLGFPGGKTKTIAVDLSGVFPAQDYRVQIRTSMEIYWDAAFFSVDEQAAEIRQQEAPLAAAELRYRGFSARGPRDHLGPESYDAAHCDPSPHWPPMLGRFTRYGEATDLVRDRDDRLAVLGAGDALELRFQKPPQDPPPGWRRDFLLYNVGWDKDADLNTVTGQTVEPLPFVAMPRYPLPADQAEPDRPELRDYRQRWQIREQLRATFWRAVRDYQPSAE